MAALSLTPFRGTRLIALAAPLGALGLGLCALGLAVRPRAALFAWLTAFCYVLSLALGALVFSMVCYCSQAKWPTALRRLTETIASVLPLLALAFLPLLFGAKELYPWVDPPAQLDEHLAHLIAHKRPYLNLPFFGLRGLFYFAIWIGVAAALARWSRRGEASSGATRARSAGPVASQPASPRSPQLEQRVLSAAALPLVALALTFAAFDWLMSLQPAWFSSIFGVYVFAGGFVASFGLLALLAFVARRSGLVAQAITRHHFHALGRLLFAFSIFWAYIAYFQGLLIQIANKPEEVTFYLHRSAQGWDSVLWLLIGGRFVLPFVLLLPRGLKLRPGAMALAGAWIALMHYVDVYWLVVPALEGHGPWPSWIDLSALVGLVGSCVAFAAWRLRGYALVPVADPWLDEAIGYRSAG